METITIQKEQRLERFLKHKWNAIPHDLLHKLLRAGKIKVNNKKRKPNYKLQQGDKLQIYVHPETQKQWMQATQKRQKTFEVLYEDKDILIVSKPPGLASQPGTGVTKNNLINQVKDYLKNNKTKPALANRLDRGSSGIVLIGKHKKSILALYDLFKDRKIKKHYYAVVQGKMPAKQGMLSTFLKKTIENFQHKTIVVQKPDERSSLAKTTYTVKETFKNFSFIELELETGKMHQIRTQLQSFKHPVLGDPVYGNKEVNKQWKKLLKRQFLHAYKVSFLHPFTKKRITVTDKLPIDLEKTLQALKAT